ncbi:hypothetical protein ACFX13_014884 [Malus domestica]
MTAYPPSSFMDFTSPPCLCLVATSSLSNTSSVINSVSMAINSCAIPRSWHRNTLYPSYSIPCPKNPYKR